MLNKYKLDKKDKLFLRILKERKYNLNKKMYQVLEAHKPSGVLESSFKSNLLNVNSKFSSEGNSRDLFKNKFIQYKFNKSNTNSSLFLSSII